jgi:hypothetical protein
MKCLFCLQRQSIVTMPHERSMDNNDAARAAKDKQGG